MNVFGFLIWLAKLDYKKALQWCQPGERQERFQWNVLPPLEAQREATCKSQLFRMVNSPGQWKKGGFLQKKMEHKGHIAGSCISIYPLNTTHCTYFAEHTAHKNTDKGVHEASEGPPFCIPAKKRDTLEAHSSQRNERCRICWAQPSASRRTLNALKESCMLPTEVEVPFHLPLSSKNA